MLGAPGVNRVGRVLTHAVQDESDASPQG